MAIPYKEAFEFGDMNPVGETTSKSYIYDNLPGSGLKAVNRAVSNSLERKTNVVGPFKGIVLRVEKPEIKEANSWDVRLEAMMAANAGQETEGETAAASPPRPRLKVRIPEMHASLPIPAELPDYGESNPNHTIVDMYPTFIAKSNQTPEPKAGDIVWVDFGNSLTQEDPIYLEPYLSNQPAMFGGGGGFGGGSAAGAFATGGSPSGGTPGVIGPLGGAPAFGPPSPCEGVCQSPLSTNWGIEALRVATAHITGGQYGESQRKGSDNSGAYITSLLATKRANPFNEYGQKSQERLIKTSRSLKDQNAWCGQFIAFLVMTAWVRAGKAPLDCPVKVSGTPSTFGGGKTWKNAGFKKIKVWNKGNPWQQINENFWYEIAPGDIAVWQRKIPPVGGHIGIVESIDAAAGTVTFIEGNLGAVGGLGWTKRRVRPWPTSAYAARKDWSQLHGTQMALRWFARLPHIEGFTGNMSPHIVWNAGPWYDKKNPSQIIHPHWQFLGEVWTEMMSSFGVANGGPVPFSAAVAASDDAGHSTEAKPGGYGG